jgi:hypothetical protein
MRDFRNAKAMARALRDALKTKIIEITHSESLELIANAFGTFDKIVSPSRLEQLGDPNSTTVSEVVRGLSSEELKDALEQGKKGVERNRRTLQSIERRLATREGEDQLGDDLLSFPELAYLKNKSRDELHALQQTAQVQLKRYEEGLRIAASVLAERGKQTV